MANFVKKTGTLILIEVQLFYTPHLTSTALAYAFDREESKHIAKVLRKKEGDQLYITNGQGELFTAEIIAASMNSCKVNILRVDQYPKKDYYLHLVVAPTKMNDRYEWFLEKATEIGIDEITPIICAHSERKVIKPERLQRILQSAMKQSLQYHLPQLNPAVSFKEFVDQPQEGTTYIAHCEQTKKQSLKAILQPKTRVTILIGPEGDFAPSEIQKALQLGFEPVSLGTTRLRTETAAIVAAHSVAFVNE